MSSLSNDKAVLAQRAFLLLNLALTLALVSHTLKPQVKLFEPFSRAQTAGFEEIGVEQAHGLAQAGQVVLVDAREKVAYQHAHIAKAVSLPAEAPLSEDVVKKLRSRPLVIYCDGPHCSLAVKLAKKLVAAGFKDIKIMEEGWEAWLQHGLPTEN